MWREKGAAVEGSQVAQRHTDVQNLGLLTHSFISVLFFQGSGTNSTAWSATIKQFLAAKMQLEPQWSMFLLLGLHGNNFHIIRGHCVIRGGPLSAEKREFGHDNYSLLQTKSRAAILNSIQFNSKLYWSWRLTSKEIYVHIYAYVKFRCLCVLLLYFIFPLLQELCNPQISHSWDNKSLFYSIIPDPTPFPVNHCVMTYLKCGLVSGGYGHLVPWPWCRKLLHMPRAEHRPVGLR